MAVPSPILSQTAASRMKMEDKRDTGSSGSEDEAVDLPGCLSGSAASKMKEDFSRDSSSSSEEEAVECQKAVLPAEKINKIARKMHQHLKISEEERYRIIEEASPLKKANLLWEILCQKPQKDWMETYRNLLHLEGLEGF